MVDSSSSLAECASATVLSSSGRLHTGQSRSDESSLAWLVRIASSLPRLTPTWILVSSRRCWRTVIWSRRAASKSAAAISRPSSADSSAASWALPPTKRSLARRFQDAFLFGEWSCRRHTYRQALRDILAELSPSAWREPDVIASPAAHLESSAQWEGGTPDSATTAKPSRSAERWYEAG
jgi:hypothetical protein